MGEVFNTERDARLVAESWDINYPQDKPHRAVRVKLVEVGEDGEVRDGE